MEARIRPLVEPVRSGNLFEATMEQLLRAIRLGHFPPGSRLPSERDLAESLGVSRTTLREALAALQDDGRVTVRRGRYGGSYVAPPAESASGAGSDEPPITGMRLDAAEVADLLTVRSVVEPAAVELAAGLTLSAADRDRLWRAHLDVGAAPVAEQRPLDSRLHLLFAELSGSPGLLAIVADVRSRLNVMLDQIPLLVANLEHSGRQHEQVARAVLDGDPDAARVSMQEHLDGTGALLRGFLG